MNNNMTTCKACGKEIAKGVKTCPHCGKDQRNFFMKHKIISAIGIIIVLCIIGGALGSKGNSDDTKPTTSSKSTKTSASTKSAATSNDDKDKLKDSYAVGETVKYKGVEMTVTKIEKSQGDDIEKPASGKEYVVVTVSIKNNSKDKLAYNPLYFKMQNSSGQIEDEATVAINEDTQLKSGDLAAGGQVTGAIVFEEPVNDKGLLLQYQDNIFSEDVKIQFKIS